MTETVFKIHTTLVKKDGSHIWWIVSSVEHRDLVELTQALCEGPVFVHRLWTVPTTDKNVHQITGREDLMLTDKIIQYAENPKNRYVE